MAFLYLQVLSFIGVVYLAILSFFAFNNYESLHLDKKNYINIGFTLFYGALFYFILFLFSSYIQWRNFKNNVNVNVNIINRNNIEMEMENYDYNNLILNNNNNIIDDENVQLLKK
jgi:sulfur relay (sulfurtransferase) DsrF/TusC family protein